MPKPLWAPWRLEYVTHADEQPGCVFCAEAAGEVEDTLVVSRGERAFVFLNKFPYSSGHLLIAPYGHLGELGELGDETALEIHRLGAAGDRGAAGDLRAGGLQPRLEPGPRRRRRDRRPRAPPRRPRWAGDTSFMPVLGDVKVLPEHLLATRDRLREAWPG